MSTPVRSPRRVLSTVGLVALAVVVASIVGLALQTKAAPAVAPAKPFHPVTGVVRPSQPSSLWIGDSYTAGTGANDQAHAESCLTAEAMGWICNVDAEGGTGFIANGHQNSVAYRPLIRRLAGDSRRYLADVVIIDAGRNDKGSPGPVLAAVRREIQGVRNDWPRAKLVLVAPYLMDYTGEVSPTITSFERQEAARLGAVFIDPVAEGWVSRARTGALTISDHLHPNPAGHRYIARHLVADLHRDGITVPITDF